MVSDGFTALCAELLAPLGPVRARAMFGGKGVYVDGLFVAIIDNDQLFLKADDTTRERFVAAGCRPFTYPTKDGERMVMSYYQPPEDALESPPLMRPWARLALEAALRAANARKPAAAKKKPAAAQKTVAKQTAAKKASAAKKTPAKRRAAGGG